MLYIIEKSEGGKISGYELYSNLKKCHAQIADLFRFYEKRPPSYAGVAYHMSHNGGATYSPVKELVLKVKRANIN